MLIVNQDKTGIYNFDNIKSIDVIENEINITDDILSNKGVVIGIYETEKRAKDVLRDLLKCMNNQKFLMKPKRNIKKETIEAAKHYFENINGIDLIIDDNNFEIIPINKDNTIIYEMPEK